MYCQQVADLAAAPVCPACESELRATPGNPDQLRLIPEQLEQQTQYFAKSVEAILWKPTHPLPFVFFASSREVVDGVAVQPHTLSALLRSQVPRCC